MSTVVKICGVRREQDAALAVELGARFVGCVQAADSPRSATPDEVRAVRDVARANGAEPVLVFRGVDGRGVLDACAATGVRRVQVHGVDRAVLDVLAGAGLAVHRVYALAAEARQLPAIEPTPDSDCPAVLDVGRGGSGRTFDWTLLEQGTPSRTLIAGGITPANVGALLRHAPFGVDVSSGVEAAPGVKDHDLMRQLFAAVRETDSVKDV